MHYDITSPYELIERGKSALPKAFRREFEDQAKRMVNDPVSISILRDLVNVMGALSENQKPEKAERAISLDANDDSVRTMMMLLRRHHPRGEEFYNWRKSIMGSDELRLVALDSINRAMQPRTRQQENGC